MLILTLETEHHMFMSAGRTEEQAVEALRSGWNEWSEKTGATYTADEVVESAGHHEIDPGMCLVDGSLILHASEDDSALLAACKFALEYLEANEGEYGTDERIAACRKAIALHESQRRLS